MPDLKEKVLRTLDGSLTALFGAKSRSNKGVASLIGRNFRSFVAPHPFFGKDFPDHHARIKSGYQDFENRYRSYEAGFRDDNFYQHYELKEDGNFKATSYYPTGGKKHQYTLSYEDGMSEIGRNIAMMNDLETVTLIELLDSGDSEREYDNLSGPRTDDAPMHDMLSAEDEMQAKVDALNSKIDILTQMELLTPEELAVIDEIKSLSRYEEGTIEYNEYQIEAVGVILPDLARYGTQVGDGSKVDKLLERGKFKEIEQDVADRVRRRTGIIAMPSGRNEPAKFKVD